METGALGHPFKHSQEKNLREHLDFPKRLRFAEMNEVSPLK